jgi:hypothetical protein
MKKNKYRITLEIAVDLGQHSTPDMWDWPELIDCNDEHDVQVLGIEEVR